MFSIDVLGMWFIEMFIMLLIGQTYTAVNKTVLILYVHLLSLVNQGQTFIAL